MIVGDVEKSRTELLAEVQALRQRVAELEKRAASQGRVDSAVRFQAQLLDEVVRQAVIATDLTGKVLYWNRFAETLYGWPADEVLGRNILDVTPSLAAAEHAQEIMAALRAGKRWSGLFRVRHRNGTEFPAFVTDTPLYNDQGELVGVAGVSVDVTERQQLETALERANRELATVLERITAAFFALDAEWRFTYLNSAAEGILERSHRELLGSNVWDMFPDARGTSFEQEFQRAMQEQVPAHFEAYYSPLQIWVEVHAYPSPEGLSVYFQDISQRKEVEAAQQRRSRQLHGLAQASLVINSPRSLKERLQNITEQARAIIGAHQAVISLARDHNWSQAINAVSLSEKYAAWRTYEAVPDGSVLYALVCHTNEPIRLTQEELEAHPAYRQHGSAAGEHPPLRGWLAAPLTGGDGSNVGLLQLSDRYEGEFTAEDEMLLMNLAQMASIAIENARLLQESRKAVRVRDAFLGMAAHELKTPVTVLIGYTHLLEQRLEAGPQTSDLAQKAVRALSEQGSRLQRLIHSLLDLISLEAGQVVLQQEHVELVSLVKHVVDELHPSFEQLDLQLDTPAAPMWVQGDQVRLEQVLQQLLQNALRHSPTGSTVRVGVEQDGANVHLTVSDEGQGIAPDILPRIFERFYQARNTGEQWLGGMGLGLYLVKELVTLHGGTIDVESVLTEGTSFRVSLPLVAAPPVSSSDETQ